MKTREKNASGAASTSAWASPRREPDIGELLPLEAGQRHGDAVEKRLAADEADIGVGLRLLDEMLAGAEADLQPDVRSARRRKALPERERFRVDLKPRQRFGEQTLLPVRSVLPRLRP